MRLFVDEAKLPLARLVFTHTLSEEDGKTEVTQRINDGLPSFFRLRNRKGKKKNLPTEITDD